MGGLEAELSVGRGRSSFGSFLKRILNGILEIVLIIVCLLVYLGIIPVFVVFMIPLYTYRFVIAMAQKIFKPSWVGMMSPRDALVGLDNTAKKCECMITVLLVMKGEANLDLIRKVFRKEVIEAKDFRGNLSYQKLQQYFEGWLGFTFWKWEKNFQLERHVREYNPVESGGDLNNNDKVITEDELMRGLGAVATSPFPYGTSPWEVLVVPKYKQNKAVLNDSAKLMNSEKDVESAVVIRIHHAVGDGYSIMKMIMANLCGDPLSAVPRAPVRKVSPLMKLLQYLAIVCLTPYYHFLQFFFNIDRTVWHLPSYKLTKQWQFTLTERISLSDVKAVSKRFGVCVTATLLAGLSGGIHNFLVKKGKAKKNSRIMRGLTPMPWKNHPMDTLVNHWTVGVFDLPVNKSCRKERLLIANQSVDHLKKSPILLTNFMTVPLLLSAPNCFTDFWGTNWMTTMIISNFPGPDTTSTAFYKTQNIREVVSWVPHMRGSAGLGVMFLSYNGGVRVSLSVDKAIIKTQKELNELRSFIEEEFNELRSLQPVTKETIV